MSLHKERQIGTAAMLGLTLIAIVGIGAAVLMHGQPSSQSHDTRLTAATAGNNTQATESAVLVTQQTPVANQNVEKVPELGITLALPDTIKDLSYQVSSVTLKNGQTATLAMFSTTSLAQLDSSCSASAGPLGSLEKVAGQYPSSDPYAALDYGRLVKQNPTFYIAAGSPQSGCSTGNSAQAAAKTHRDAFYAAEPSVQQAN